MDTIIDVMVNRLVSKGIEITSIPALIRNLANTIADNPNIELSELNDRMQSLGWNNIDLDEHSFQLVIAIFESDFLGTDNSEKSQAISSIRVSS